jgi:hypothetical protein
VPYHPVDDQQGARDGEGSPRGRRLEGEEGEEASGQGFLSHPGPEAARVCSAVVLLSPCLGSSSEPWWLFLLYQQPPPHSGLSCSEPEPEYVEGTCVHRHRQCALRVLHLWPARSQVSGLSIEGPSNSDLCKEGTSLGSAVQASHGSHPRLSHSLDHGGCSRRP